jgi:succinate dehydrogenase/fumarate reductase flavoprotein subunit
VVEQYPDAKEMERATDARAEHYAFSLHDGSGRIDAAIFRAAERGGCWMSSRSEHAPVHMFARVCNGGIAVDERGRTGIEGLFACGEAATGMHGAIRLGGEYLTSALVFGNLAGRSAVDFARGSKPSDAPLAQEEPLNASQGLGEGELENYGKMIREAVSAKAMVIRTRADLQGALGVIQVAEGVVKTKGCRDQAALAAWHQTRHMAACAKMLLEQALAQTESLGPHMIE